MESNAAITALSALAQENRLAVFRALVQSGSDGLRPGELAEQLGVAANTLSFHLAQLRHAGLISVVREGRTLTYAVDFSAMNTLLGFLTENCCGGDAASCAVPECKPPLKKSRARRARRTS